MALRDAQGHLETSHRPGEPAKRLVIAVLDRPSAAAAYQILEIDAATGARVPLAISFPTYVDAHATRRALDRDYGA